MYFKFIVTYLGNWAEKTGQLFTTNTTSRSIESRIPEWTEID